MRRFQSLFALLFLAFFAVGAFSAPRNVGHITALSGDVKIVRESREEPARLGDPVQRGDTVVTLERAKVQITFEDRTMITLGEKSHLSIDDYLYDDASDSKARFGATKGIFRVLTGKIGKIAPERFELRTENATVGIRGTEFVVQTDPRSGDRITCVMGLILVTPHRGAAIEVPAGKTVYVRPDGTTTISRSGGFSRSSQENFGMVADPLYVNTMSTDIAKAQESETVASAAEQVDEQSGTTDASDGQGSSAGSGTGGGAGGFGGNGGPAEGETVVDDRGFIAIGFQEQNGQTDTWIRGDETPGNIVAQELNSGQTFRYEGKVAAVADGAKATGDSRIDISTADETFKGTLDFRAEGGPRWIVYVEGNVRKNNSTPLYTNNLQSAEGSEVRIQSGEFSGKFYGTGANSMQGVGGTFRATSDDGREAKGVYDGVRAQN